MAFFGKSPFARRFLSQRMREIVERKQAQAASAPTASRPPIAVGKAAPTAPERRIRVLERAEPEERRVSMDRQINANGWMVGVLNKMAKMGTVVMPSGISPTEIATLDGPLVLNHRSGADLLNACKIAVQGHAEKSTTSGVKVAATDLVVSLTEKAFGYVVRIAGPVTNFPNGIIALKVIFDKGASTEKTYNYIMKGTNNVYEAIILAYSDNAGRGQVVPADTIEITIVDGTSPVVDGETWLSIESLNARDLGAGR